MFGQDPPEPQRYHLLRGPLIQLPVVASLRPLSQRRSSCIESLAVSSRNREVHPAPHLPHLQPLAQPLSQRRGARRVPGACQRFASSLVLLLRFDADDGEHLEDQGDAAEAGRRRVRGRVQPGHLGGGFPSPDGDVRAEGQRGNRVAGAAQVRVRELR